MASEGIHRIVAELPADQEAAPPGARPSVGDPIHGISNDVVDPIANARERPEGPDIPQTPQRTEEEAGAAAFPPRRSPEVSSAGGETLGPPLRLSPVSAKMKTLTRQTI